MSTPPDRPARVDVVTPIIITAIVTTVAVLLVGVLGIVMFAACVGGFYWMRTRNMAPMSPWAKRLVPIGIALGAAAVPMLFRAYGYEGKWFTLASTALYLSIVLAMAACLAYYNMRALAGDEMYIRRIPGVDAIEEAVGRSTEMGRPVLYVTGVEDITNIQTIASLLVLGHVSKLTAEYDTDIKVANFYPITMVVAEEIVRQGFASAGRPDAHKPQNVMFISSEQFAFAAGVNGIIVRDRPATNIYLGRFFAESLILAETGYLTKAIQIAGTAEITQLPFFIAACDYTLLGEEIYAVSAYMTREPVLLAMLKSGDLIKAGLIVLLLVGAALATINDLRGATDAFDLAKWMMQG